MKKILSILTIFGFSVQAMAQDIKVAPELGGTYQTMTQKLNGYNYQTNFQAGLRVGGIVDIGYNKNFSLQTGASSTQTQVHKAIMKILRVRLRLTNKRPRYQELQYHIYPSACLCPI